MSSASWRRRCCCDDKSEDVPCDGLAEITVTFAGVRNCFPARGTGDTSQWCRRDLGVGYYEHEYQGGWSGDINGSHTLAFTGEVSLHGEVLCAFEGDMGSYTWTVWLWETEFNDECANEGVIGGGTHASLGSTAPGAHGNLHDFSGGPHALSFFCYVTKGQPRKVRYLVSRNAFISGVNYMPGDMPGRHFCEGEGPAELHNGHSHWEFVRSSYRLNVGRGVSFANSHDTGCPHGSQITTGGCDQPQVMYSHHWYAIPGGASLLGDFWTGGTASVDWG